VKLVEVFVVAGAQLGLEVNAFADTERRINLIEIEVIYVIIVEMTA
jgi:hypothetical protein